MSGFRTAAALPAYVLASLVLIFSTQVVPAFAQPGSTGGTLGKTDQSLSGGGPTESPDKGKSLKRSAPGKESSDKAAVDGLPRTVNIIERSSFGEFRAQLTRGQHVRRHVEPRRNIPNDGHCIHKGSNRDAAHGYRRFGNAERSLLG